MTLAASIAVFLLLLLPPGVVILRCLGVRFAGGQHLGLALAAGYMTVLPVRLLEEFAGLPIVVPMAAVWLLALLRTRLPLSEWRAALGRLVLPLGLACLAGSIAAGDMQALPEGALAFRTGFDVSDRAIYASFAEELERSPPPHSQNPLFAGVRSGYSFFPSLLGLVIHDYAPVSLLAFYMLPLPVLAFFMLGLCLDGLLEALGISSFGARAVTVLLTILGGDLSWMLDTRNLTAFQRTSQFFVFHSFSAESLFFNPWMLGLPLALAGLHAAFCWISKGELRLLVLAGALLGGLWGTKVFACLPLLAGAWFSALLFRHRRLFLLAVASSLGALPWAAFTWLSADPAAASPLIGYPFLVVRTATGVIRGLEPVARFVAQDGIGSILVLAAMAPAFLAGSLGVRVLGLPALVARLRDDREGFHRFVGISLAAAVVLGLGTKGRPVATDGAQFLTLALYLLWLYAGPVVAGMLGRSGLFRGLGLALMVVAMVNPVRYLVLRAFPDTWAPAGSWDRVSLVLPPQVGAACDWLRRSTPPSDALLMRLQGDPGDVGGLKALYVAALAERRLAAYSADFGVEPAVGSARREAAAAVYATADPAEAEQALRALGVRWVWEESALPLQFASPRLALRFDSPLVRLHEFLP